jgi:uncharacterized membrane protein YfcA
VALAGGLLGLVLGNIRLPVLLAAGSSPAAAAGANIAVSGVAAATAAVRHVRAGRIDRRLTGWMIVPSVAGAVAGGYAATVLPANALRIVIGSSLVAFGLDLLRRRNAPLPKPAGAPGHTRRGCRRRCRRSDRRPDRVDLEHAPGAGPPAVGAAAAREGDRHEPGRRHRGRGRRLLGHLPGGIDWSLLLVGAVSSIPGAIIGSRYTGRLSPEALLRAIGVILLIGGTVTIVRGAL